MPTFPQNPWSTTFTGGTKISSGMNLAVRIAAAQKKPATVILVSDLDDQPGDLPALGQVLRTATTEHVPVNIVGLNPTPTDETFFRSVLGPNAPITEAPTLADAPPHNVTPFPWALVWLAVAAAAALTALLAWEIGRASCRERV